MATIYHGTIKTVSPFISLPPSEIEGAIVYALNNYQHSSGLRLESTEVYVHNAEPRNQFQEGVMTGLLMAREILEKGGDLDKLISLNR